MALDPNDGRLVKRHRLSTRLWHWTNAVCVVILLMSGLGIFNAHPRLYWGQYGANPDYAWFAVGATPTTGFVRIGETRIETTGVLGRWTDGKFLEIRYDAGGPYITPVAGQKKYIDPVTFGLR